MNLCRCDKGHFYDLDKHPVCPICAEEGLVSPVEQPAPEVEEQTPALEPEVERVEQQIVEEQVVEEDLTTTYEEPVIEEVGETVTRYEPMLDETDEVTEAYYESTETVDDVIEDEPTPVPEPVAAPEEPAYADDDDEHTMAYMDEMINEVATGSSSAKTDTGRPMSPCVGWVIATSGAHMGQDFRLKTGKNFLGRGADMDVVLSGDKSVSRNRHAIIIYEPRQHMYLIQPGESSGLVYHNDEVVLNPVKLEAYDKITLGDVDMIFIPLCDENFNWSDILNGIKKD